MAKIRREALQGSDGWEGGRLELYCCLGVYCRLVGGSRLVHSRRRQSILSQRCWDGDRPMQNTREH